MGGVSRRELLKIIGAAAVTGIIGYAAGRVAGGKTVSTPTAVTPSTTASSSTFTSTPSTRKVKAAWIYVGPIGDYGWTYAHEMGRRYVQSRLSWLESTYKESVPESEGGIAIDQLVEKGYEVIFTTSFGYMDATFNAAEKYPDKWFWHCSGYKRRENMGTYFAELYQIYYLNGLLAGAVTKTGKVGYVPAHLIPEVRRHINAFALGCRDGARMVGRKDVKVYVTSELGEWYCPDKARVAAKMLVDNYDVDVIAYTEDSPTVLQVAEEYQTKYNKRVWSFSHYSDMYKYGPHAHLTGQIVNWGPIYEHILIRYYAGVPSSEDIWARLGDFEPVRWMRSPEKSLFGKPEGCVYMARVKEEVVPENVLAFAKTLYEQMKELLFDPFSGFDPVKKEPRDIYDNEGHKVIEKGARLSHDDLWNIQWFLDNIELLG